MNYLTAVDGCFLDSPSGSARVAWDIALAMRDRGHHVAMVCFAPDEQGGLSQAEGIGILRVPRVVTRPWNPRRLTVNTLAVREAVQKTLTGRRWDVVHLHIPAIADGVVMALGQEPRYVYTVHSLVAMEQRINWGEQGLLGKVKLIFGLRKLHNLEHRLLASSSAIHVLSQFSRSCVEQFHGMGSKVTVIPHWRRPDLYRTVTKSQARVALGWPQQEKILLTVRRLAVRMGLDVALEALVPLAAAGRCVFMVGGEGPLRSVLEAQARAAGVGPDRIRFLGRLPEERLKLAYQAADVFVLPTRALEGFGLITVEALAFGCPVIGTDAGSTPEILDPILPGMIVPAGNIEALREKVSEFLEGRLALPDAQEIVQYVASRYDPLVVLPRFYTLLEG